MTICISRVKSYYQDISWMINCKLYLLTENNSWLTFENFIIASILIEYNPCFRRRPHDFGKIFLFHWLQLSNFCGLKNLNFASWSFSVLIRPIISALSFYKSQIFLFWSKFFVPDQKFIYILWQSQIFCARQKDDLHSVKLVFVPAQKVFQRY